MKKRFLGIVVAILVVVLFTFSACMPQDNSDYDKQIEDLQKQIDELQQAVKDKNGESEDLQSQLDELQQTLEEKAHEIQDLQEQLEKAQEERNEQETTAKYTFTLDYAYESGMITREDVMHFCYYSYGVVLEGDKSQRETDWVKVDFTPTEERGELSESADAVIKYAYLVENLYDFYIRGKLYAHPEEFQIKNYFVTSNGCYIVQMHPGGGGASVVARYFCAGIAWLLPMPEVFFVFKF